MDEIRKAINIITGNLGYSLDKVYITEDGDVLTNEDIDDLICDGAALPEMQTAREWYEASLFDN